MELIAQATAHAHTMKQALQGAIGQVEATLEALANRNEELREAFELSS